MSLLIGLSRTVARTRPPRLHAKQAPLPGTRSATGGRVARRPPPWPIPASRPRRTIRSSPLRPTCTRIRAPTRSRPSGSGALRQAQDRACRDSRGDGDRHAGGARVIFLPTAPLHEATRQEHGSALPPAREAGGGGVCRRVGCGAGARGAAAGGLCAFFCQAYRFRCLRPVARAKRHSQKRGIFLPITVCQVCQATALKRRKRNWALALPLSLIHI